MPKTDPRLLAAIGANEVKTSDEVVQFLSGQGQSPPAARGMLSRAAKSGRIWRSEHCRLPQNGRLFARPDFAGTNDFFIAASEKIGETDRKGLARCLTGVSEEGALLDITARKYLATALDENSERARYPTFEQELAALGEFGIDSDSLASGDRFLFARRVDIELAATAALQAVTRRRIECLLARILVDTLRRQNILSWNRYEVASPTDGAVYFNKHAFSAFGYSYLDPMVVRNDRGRDVGCPVLIDVFADTCNAHHLEGFCERLLRATFRGRSRQRHLGVIAAPDFQVDAWNAARQRKLWTVNLRQMFGDQALDALAEVEKLLREVDAGTQDGREIQSITRLLSELKANPIVTTLRSISFEAVAALVARSLGCEGVGLALDVPFQQTTRDVDVYGRRGNELWIIECKAIAANKDLDPADVRKFYAETLPAYVRYYRSRESAPFEKVIAEVWTTGKVCGTAMQELGEITIASNVQARIRGYQEIVDQTPSGVRGRIEELLTAIAVPISRETGMPLTT